jgi:hypothetical protein
MSQLVQLLTVEIAECRRLAQRNYIAAYFIFASALTATALATFVSASELPPVFRAFVTALPGLLILAHNTLRFQQKARWYWMKVRGLEALLNKLQLEGASVPEVSKEFSELNLLLENDWPAFEPLPTEPPKQPGRPMP